MADSMIELHAEHFLGEGHQRLCYRHPEDSTLCIKVLKPRLSAAKQHKQELWVLKRLLDVDEAALYITGYLGEISTSKGDGYLFPLLTDSNGSQARNLSTFLKSDLYERTELQRQLLALGHFLLKHGVIFRDVNASNILCPIAENGTYQLIIIDGLGDRVGFPISLMNEIPFLVKRKVRRRWLKFLQQLAESNPWLEIEKLTI